MAVRVSMRINGLSQVASRLRRGASTVERDAATSMRAATVAVERHVKRNMLSGAPRSHPLFGRLGAASPSLGSVTGHLRRSVRSSTIVVRSGASPTVVGTVGTPVAYARTHEDGATIHGNPWLRIPTRYAKTGAGVDRLAGVSARSDPSLFVVKSKAGKLWIVRMPGNAKKLRERAAARALAGERRGSAGARGVKHRKPMHFWPGLVPMYLLVKSVTISKRAPFRTAMIQTKAQVTYILRQVGRRLATSIGGS